MNIRLKCFLVLVLGFLSSVGSAADDQALQTCALFPVARNHAACVETVKVNPQVSPATLAACVRLYPVATASAIDSCLEISRNNNVNPDSGAIAMCGQIFGHNEWVLGDCLQTIRYSPGINAQQIQSCDQMATLRGTHECLVGFCEAHNMLGACTAAAR